MLDLARDAIAPELRPGVSFVRSSVDDFEHTPFDVVLCLGVLAHVPDVDAALRKLVSLVAPGGRCVLQLTDHVEPSARLSDAFYRLKKRVRDISGYEVHKTSATDVLKRMQDLGMRPIGMRQYWVLPPLFGRLPVSLGRKLLAALYDSPQASAWGSEKIFAFEKRRSA
jgi:SAM-dependent methyltransferase